MIINNKKTNLIDKYENKILNKDKTIKIKEKILDETKNLDSKFEGCISLV